MQEAARLKFYATLGARLALPLAQPARQMPAAAVPRVRQPASTPAVRGMGRGAVEAAPDRQRGLLADAASPRSGTAGNGSDIARNRRDVAGNGSDIAGEGKDVAGNGCDIAGNGSGGAGTGSGVAGSANGVAGDGSGCAGNGGGVAGEGSEFLTWQACTLALSGCGLAKEAVGIEVAADRLPLSGGVLPLPAISLRVWPFRGRAAHAGAGTGARVCVSGRSASVPMALQLPVRTRSRGCRRGRWCVPARPRTGSAAPR